MLLAVAVLVAFTFASLSCALALTLRQRESVIGINTMLTLPLTFLSAAFLPLALTPDWIETAATYNPINWAIQAGREVLVASPDWSFVLPRVGGLAVVALVSVALATLAFRSYQRSASSFAGPMISITVPSGARTWHHAASCVRSTSVISSRPRASSRALVASTSSTRSPTTGPVVKKAWSGSVSA